MLVPVGASLLAGDNLVSTVKGFATKYRTRSNFERELKRYERRGVDRPQPLRAPGPPGAHAHGAGDAPAS